MPDKMVSLKVDETSGVDHPAHLHEGWVVMKAADADTEEHTVPEQDDTKTTDGAAGDTEVTKDARISELEEQVASLTSALETAQAAPTAPEGDAGATEDPIEKAVGDMPESVREAFRKEREERESLAKALETERSERADEKAVEKARAYLPLGLDPAKVGPSLRMLKEANADLGKAIEQMLEGLVAQVDTSDLFKAAGSDGDGTDQSATEQVMAKAKALVDDGTADSFAKAVEQVAVLHPDLYAEHRAARR